MKTGKITRAGRALGGLVGLVLAMSAAASTINTAWSIQGEGAARPVQVFDDGANIYVQVRDTASAPAPVGPNGPVAFTMRGHYLVLPMMPSFRLHLGASAVDVISGQIAPARRLPPGVASITAPVQAKELPPLPAPTVAPSTQSQAPAAGGYVPTRLAVPPVPKRTTQAPAAPAPVGARSDDVLGDIVVGGRVASGAVARPGAGVLTNAASATDIDRALTAIPVGIRVRIRADGTVAGANAARRVSDQCVRLARECVMTFRGAAAGQIQLEKE